MPRDSEGRPVSPIDVATVDPNRRHEFIEHDRERRCYVCNRKRSSEWHR